MDVLVHDPPTDGASGGELSIEPSMNVFSKIHNCIDNIASVLNIDIGIQESSFQSACEVPISHSNESILSSIQNMHQILGGTRTSYPPKNINVSNIICKTPGEKNKMIKPEDYSRTLEFLLSLVEMGC